MPMRMTGIEKLAGCGMVVATFDNGKTVKFDLSTGNRIGVTGKVIRNYSSAYLCAMTESELSKTFWAKAMRGHFSTVAPNMLETLSVMIEQGKYSEENLVERLEICSALDKTPNKQFMAQYDRAITALENSSYSVDRWHILKYFNDPSFVTRPREINNLLDRVNTHRTISSKEDIKSVIERRSTSIMNRAHAEDWGCNTPAYRLKPSETGNWSEKSYVRDCIVEYIDLCLFLKKDADFRFLFSNLPMLRKEYVVATYCAEDSRLLRDADKLAYENDEFIVTVGKTKADYDNEGDKQHNCVFRLYYDAVVQGRTHVVFIRKKSDPNTPYITCEVRNDGEIWQYYLAYNRSPKSDSAESRFETEYQRYLNSQNWD